MFNAILFLMDILFFFVIGVTVSLIIIEGDKEKESEEYIRDINNVIIPKSETQDSKASIVQPTETEPNCLSKIDKSHSYSEFEIDASGKDENSYIREKMKTQEEKFRKTKKETV